MLVITDSNTYLRIARNLHPLLGREFGRMPYLLNIHLTFEEEYSNNSRLQNQFQWVAEKSYKDNRKKNTVIIPKEQVQELFKNISFIVRYKNKNKLTISRADIWALSSALLVGAELLTDDPDLLIAAEEYEVKAIKTIEFLGYLKGSNEIDMFKINEIIDYWIYDKDYPTGFHKDMKAYLPEYSINN